MSKLMPIDVDFKMEAHLLINTRKKKGVGEFKGTVLRECLLSFGAESVVFQIAIQKLKDQDI